MSIPLDELGPVRETVLEACFVRPWTIRSLECQTPGQFEDRASSYYFEKLSLNNDITEIPAVLK